MKIGIMADSHENMDKIRKVVKIFNELNVEVVFHAGDIISPITFKEFKDLRSRFYGVFGNNDGEKNMLKEKFKQIGEIFERYYETEIQKTKILLMHEPYNLDALISSQKYDVIIYGHTHILDLRKEGRTLVINPGECGGWLYGKSTAVVLTLPEKDVKVIEI